MTALDVKDVSGGALQFERIARHLTQRIESGEFPPGSVVPTVKALAEDYGVSRGTVRHALELVEQSQKLLTRRGRRWIVHEPTLPVSFNVLRSFAQWARTIGHKPSGRTVSLEWGRANADEALHLGIPLKEAVLRCRRVRFLDGTPVMVERTTYPEYAAQVIEGLPADVPSISDVLQHQHRITLAHAEHTITATEATASDSDLLDVERGAPLLRIRRTGRAQDGRAFEYSEDRYLPYVVEFSVVSTTAEADS